MIIKYRQEYIRADLIFGGIYILLGTLGFVFKNPFISYGFSVTGVFFLMQYFYKKKHQYMKIEGDNLILNSIYSNRKIDLKAVTRIKKFADEITFLTPHEKLKISTNLIAKEDLPYLEETLASLSLKVEKNPFRKQNSEPQLKNPLFGR